MAKKLRVVAKYKRKMPVEYMLEVEKGVTGRLRAFQKFVGGLIDIVETPYNPNLLFVINDEGKLVDDVIENFNFPVHEWGDIVCGDALVVADNGRGGVRDMTDAEIQQTIDWFNANFEDFEEAYSVMVVMSKIKKAIQSKRDNKRGE